LGGRDRACRDRFRGSQREGRRTRAGDPARRRRRGRVRRGRRGQRRAPAQPAVRKHARTGLPAGHPEDGDALDGQTSTGIGQSKWISGEQSRALVTAGAPRATRFAVGIGTVFADDPRSTRPPARRPPAAAGRLRLAGAAADRLASCSGPSSESPLPVSSPAGARPWPPRALENAARAARRQWRDRSGPGRSPLGRPRSPRRHQPLPRGRPDAGPRPSSPLRGRGNRPLAPEKPSLARRLLLGSAATSARGAGPRRLTGAGVELRSRSGEDTLITPATGSGECLPA